MSLDLEQNDWPYDSAATVISIDAEVVISRTGSNGVSGATVTTSVVITSAAVNMAFSYQREHRTNREV